MDDDAGRSGSPFKILLLLAAVGAAAMAILKKRREAELDEALWEEPRAL